MRSKLLPSLLLGLLPRVTAVFKDEVDDIDFHYPLLGLPQIEKTFFHRPRKDDKASLLYTLSDLGLLGAVNPSNGGLVWRHQLGPAVGDDDDDNENGSRAAFLRAPEGEECVVSAYDSGVQAWNALTGRSLWHINFNGRVRDLKILELSESSRKDVLALFEEDGTTVLRRLHGLAGTVVWEFRETSKDVPLHVSNDISNVYVVSLHGSTSSYNLNFTSLETATGARVDHWMLGNKGDIHHAGDVLLAGTNSAAPIIGWAKQGLAKLSVNVLGRKSTQELALPPDTISVELHTPHLAQSQPHFLVHVQMKKKSDEGEKSHKAMVYHTNLKTGQVKLAYELPAFKGEGVFATSSDEANVYFAQIDSDETRIFSSESHGLLAKWPNGRAADISPVDAVTEVVKKADGRDFAVRSAIVTKAGDWVLLRNGDRDWTRHEGLSGAVAAVWVEIAEGEDLAKVLAEEAHTNPLSAYIHRVKRHFDDLKHLPGSLASITERFVKSMTGGEAVSNRDGVLRRDSFGFNKILVLVTRRGRLYGIDSGNHGKIIWTRSWWPLDTDGPVRIKGLAADDARGVVSVYESGGSYAAFNASSGAIIEMIEAAGEDSRVSSTAVIDDELGRKLFAVGRDGLPLRPLPASWDADQTIVVRGEDQTLRGVKFTSRGGKTTRQEAWQLPMRPGLKIVQVATLPSHDPVASIGRVLGDRGVLYKYLNANSMVMAAADVTAHTLSVQLVDMSSGQVLASQLYRGVDSRQAISCAMAENWYACSFFGDYSLNDQTGRAIKGYQVAVTDLYESPEPNSRGPLGEAANLSATAPVDSPTGGMPLPWTVSQAYVLSQPLTKLAVTQTRQGISTRELVGYLPEAHGIAGLSRHALDPRRPVGRDPTAADMEAEALARYAPALEIDGRMVLSHKRDVAGVAALVPAPALVESTGLLAAYGVDVYVTRVAPSGVFDILGKGFNKATLVATVVALLGGVLFLAPMVRRKQIDRRWEGFL